jgi:hypothetical protein
MMKSAGSAFSAVVESTWHGGLRGVAARSDNEALPSSAGIGTAGRDFNRPYACGRKLPDQPGRRQLS